uniref:Uncharacterized protein n=1 Tax=Nelumbo nucifera TaxID=4432 RepID=A0A822XMJ6_NELNU|nr:TPA_asm: hypothetical protein HUJ06_021894 [Nelumbo nucifera]
MMGLGRLPPVSSSQLSSFICFNV